MKRQRKQTLTWIATILLLLAGLAGLTSRELKRQRARELTARSTATQSNVSSTAEVKLIPMSDEAHPPAPVGVRYPHRQLGRSGSQLAAIYHRAKEGVAIVGVDLDEAEAAPQEYPVEWLGQPTLAYVPDPEANWWIAAQVQDLHSAGSDGTLKLSRSSWREWPGTQEGPVSLAFALEPIAFPNLAASSNEIAVSMLMTDSLGASSIRIWSTLLVSEHAFITISRPAEWQTWQPPDIRFIDDERIALVLRAEAPPKVANGTREVDSAVLGWRFPLSGDVPDPEVLFPATPGVFTERPVLASDGAGHLAVAIGHWGPPQLGGMRGYDLAILIADGMGKWEEVASPLTSQAHIGTAQPQLARDGETLLLVWSLESNEIQSELAHRIQWSLSRDKGATWSTPKVLVEGAPEVQDHPLDLIADRNRATLLFQRESPAPALEGTIRTDPPLQALFVAEWEY